MFRTTAATADGGMQTCLDSLIEKEDMEMVKLLSRDKYG